jgi:hypothetical protein
MAKIMFWIHRFDSAKTAQIMTKILRSKPYIKVSVQKYRDIQIYNSEHSCFDSPMTTSLMDS